MENRQAPERIIGVGGVLIEDNRVLLVRRANHPAKGYWAIPGGRIEGRELLRDALKREMFEETGIVIRVAELLHTFDFYYQDESGLRHYIIIDYRVSRLSGQVSAGDDATAAAWLSAAALDEKKVAPETLTLLQEMGFMQD
jgi:8-oxo-dGTP diphosphatase